jgi:hypothetical protein
LTYALGLYSPFIGRFTPPATGGGLDVIQQLHQRLATDWKATLRAVDGAVTKGWHAKSNSFLPM